MKIEARKMVCVCHAPRPISIRRTGPLISAAEVTHGDRKAIFTIAVPA